MPFDPSGTFTDNYLFPWLPDVQANVLALQQLAGKVPAALEPSRHALETAGEQIQLEIDQHHTVSSDDAKHWLAMTENFARHLPANMQAPLLQHAASGQAVPDDGVSQQATQIASGAASAAGAAAGAVAKVVPQLPWGWIALAGAAIVGAPLILESLLSPSPRRRK
jgi:hypothetical protein